MKTRKTHLNAWNNRVLAMHQKAFINTMARLHHNKQ
jgi:hypothetical protein